MGQRLAHLALVIALASFRRAAGAAWRDQEGDRFLDLAGRVGDRDAAHPHSGVEGQVAVPPAALGARASGDVARALQPSPSSTPSTTRSPTGTPSSSPLRCPCDYAGECCRKQLAVTTLTGASGTVMV
jgi:hypothetical protein